MMSLATERAPARWLNAGLSFFYPETCQICKSSRATAGEGFVCAGCRQQVRFITPPFCERCGLPFAGDITTAFECANCRGMELHFRSARSAVAAGGVVRETVHGYKYQHALWFEPFLADLLVRAAVPELAKEKWDLMVPVPLHPARKREREFNQAERLANRLGKAARIPVRTNLLRRVEPTRTQTQLARDERITNVRNAFATRRQQKLDGERIVLVDDVFTTGATTSACARVLKKAGAGDICVWTVARGL
jgi:competence protein ComFC